ncbi:MAG: asparaginase [Leptolyngbya sp. PLA2]|nr:asparaginase [Leptolyngbya sp.]MCE7971329.1 asparaginase [Leptolyngbya sp. PL-A2]MCQ3940546.1 asparaginase [cyanobacterium CYA1]MCZ7632458.1 asparaginase [Phycisphaerales bacterium]MDL1903516.1 asparaginase [Synechococcales cyanobacterium CNB]GIK19987.1 MAG: asparaginase [Planctomycetota bacterium]
MRTITVITTGGTIEKTFDERTGSLENRGSILRRMLRRIRLEETDTRIVELMSKDSLLMGDADRARIVAAVKDALASRDVSGVVVLHGTDTLEHTGEALHAALGVPRVPVVITGAMRPFEMKRSDALQNLTEALFAVGVLPPGVYCVAHGRALRFPGVVKNRERSTFVRAADRP